MVRRLLIIASLAFACMGAGKPKLTKPTKTWQTYPMPPHIKPADPMAISPAYQIPENPERYVWKIAAPKNDPKVQQAPIYYRGWNGRFSKIGNVPMGTTLTLDLVYASGPIHYYAFKYTGADGKQVDAWVSGMYVAPAGLAPVQ